MSVRKNDKDEEKDLLETVRRLWARARLEAVLHGSLDVPHHPLWLVSQHCRSLFVVSCEKAQQKQSTFVLKIDGNEGLVVLSLRILLICEHR